MAARTISPPRPVYARAFSALTTTLRTSSSKVEGTRTGTYEGEASNGRIDAIHTQCLRQTHLCKRENCFCDAADGTVPGSEVRVSHQLQQRWQRDIDDPGWVGGC